MKNFENNSPVDPERRGFLGKMVGAALAVGAMGVVTNEVVNKYQEEEDLNTLRNSLEGQGESFSKANGVAKMLLDEMVKGDIKAVKLSGEGHSNNRIEILRSFLTEHLNSTVGVKYESKKQLWAAGAYTKESLATLIAESSALAEKHGK